MNTSIQSLSFNGIPVTIVDHQNEAWMSGDDIGTALEYNSPVKRISDIFNKNKDELEEFTVVRKLRTTDGKQYNTRVYNEEGVMLICMFSNQPKAKEFRRWAVGVLKNYRKAPPLETTHEALTMDEYYERQLAIKAAQQALLNTQIVLTGAELAALKVTPELIAELRNPTETKPRVQDQIIQLVKAGNTRKEICARLGLSSNNVRQHIFNAKRDGLLTMTELFQEA